MPTLTIELPDDTYQLALALPLDERKRVIVAAFATAHNTSASLTFADHVEGEPYPDLPDLPAAHVAAIAEGIADTDAGRVRPVSELFAELRAERETRKRS